MPPQRKGSGSRTGEFMATATANKSSAQDTRWNFSNTRHTYLWLDQFREEKHAAGFTFYTGKEPWLDGIQKLDWQTFFRVCTQEMDDISERA